MSTTVDDETILEILRSNDAPRMTTTEVAGQLPVTRGTTRTRLQGLVDDGLLEREREGNNVVWWLPEREDELEAWESESAAESEEGEADDADTDEGETDDAEGTEPEPDDTSVEVEATEQAESGDEDGDTTVEVEAVDDEGVDEVEVTTPDEGTETRTAADRDDGETAKSSPADRRRAELSDDEEGLRALALLAAAIVVFLLFRKLLSGDGEDEETE